MPLIISRCETENSASKSSVAMTAWMEWLWITAPALRQLMALKKSARTYAGGPHLAKEHPNNPKNKKAEKKGYTVDDLDKAIRSAIAAKETNGIYQLKDGDKTWDLKLDKVHRERLSRIDESTYFACTDFK